MSTVNSIRRMSPKGGRLTGAGSFAPLTAAATDNRRLYLGLRSASRKLEVISDNVQRALSELPNCLAFHHTGYLTVNLSSDV